LALAADLAAREERFALVTVVRREPPSSARVGDTALVTALGDYHGWAGGGCTRSTVVREALRAIADGEPRFISLSPEAPTGRGGRGVRALPHAGRRRGSRANLAGPRSSARAPAPVGQPPRRARARAQRPRDRIPRRSGRPRRRPRRFSRSERAARDRARRRA